MKFTKAKPGEDGSSPVDLAIPAFGYQNHVSIDRGFGFIRKWSATDAAAYEGRQLREGLLDKTNTASGVWADTAYRSAANEAFMDKNGFVSHVHRKKPKGRAMPEAMRRANAAKSKIRSKVEHVFAEQKDRMDLFIRTIGIARATMKIGLGEPRLQHQETALLAAGRGGLTIPPLAVVNAARTVRVRRNPATRAAAEISPSAPQR